MAQQLRSRIAMVAMVLSLLLTLTGCQFVGSRSGSKATTAEFLTDAKEALRALDIVGASVETGERWRESGVQAQAAGLRRFDGQAGPP